MTSMQRLTIDIFIDEQLQLDVSSATSKVLKSLNGMDQTVLYIENVMNAQPDLNV